MIGAMELHVLVKELDETENKQFLPQFYKLLAEVVDEIIKELTLS